MDEKDIIAKNITYYRKKCGLSQLELADKLQYSNKNISKWEKGETVPSIFTLKRLAEIFGITVDKLISSEENAGTSEVSESEQAKKPRQLLGKVLWLLLANAILLACACVAIYVLSVLEITQFNKWLLLLYILPLSAISVFIFIACVKRRVDIISISLAGWLTALSLYLTLTFVSGIEYIFFLMAGLQVVALFLMPVINNHIKNRKNKNE